jgi:hypothetical protein
VIFLKAITYLNPNLRYPALSMYHFDMGFNQRCSHGRFITNGAREGTDIVAVANRRSCGGEVRGGGEMRCCCFSGQSLDVVPTNAQSLIFP